MTDGLQPRKRPKTAEGTTHKIVTGCGNLYVTINSDKQGIFEIFAHLGKSGQCGAAQSEALCRSMSIGLRAGVDTEYYIKQLKGIRCPSPGLSDGIEVLSCADGISRALEQEIKEVY